MIPRSLAKNVLGDTKADGVQHLKPTAYFTT